MILETDHPNKILSQTLAILFVYQQCVNSLTTLSARNSLEERKVGWR